jgi:hypothetical protein
LSLGYLSHVERSRTKELNLSLGDRIRITSSIGVSDALIVAGIYIRAADEKRLCYLLTGQSLFGVGNSANVVG